MASQIYRLNYLCAKISICFFRANNRYTVVCPCNLNLFKLVYIFSALKTKVFKCLKLSFFA